MLHVLDTHLQFLLLCFLTLPSSFFFFFFNDTATTEIYTLSLHDALPISGPPFSKNAAVPWATCPRPCAAGIQSAPKSAGILDRKSTRLNSSHGYISYAVFCLKKKKKNTKKTERQPYK